jgi:hypothetical protein
MPISWAKPLEVGFAAGTNLSKIIKPPYCFENVGDGCSLLAFSLPFAETEFGYVATRLLDKDGAEIRNINLLRDGDDVYLAGAGATLQRQQSKRLSTRFSLTFSKGIEQLFVGKLSNGKRLKGLSLKTERTFCEVSRVGTGGLHIVVAFLTCVIGYKGRR